MVYLCVPMREKDEVYKLGARYDGKGWFIPKGKTLDCFKRWLPRIYTVKKGQIPLTIELVPDTSWFINLHHQDVLPPEIWDKIKRTVFQEAGYRCQICGEKGPKWPVECHEEWLYDDSHHIQKLEGFLALCPKCHEVKHIGLASLNGHYQNALDWLKKINKWQDYQAKQYINDQIVIHKERSTNEWTIDISFIKDSLLPE